MKQMPEPYLGRLSFKCPQCRRIHNATQDDFQELQCTDNETSEIKIGVGLDNPSALTSKGWGFNRFQTKVSTYRNASVVQRVRVLKDDIGRIKNW